MIALDHLIHVAGMHTKGIQLAQLSQDVQLDAFTVTVDDNFHYQDLEHRYVIDGFCTFDEALAKCKSIVDSSLEECAEPGRSAEEIFDHYRSFGEDPWISPPGDVEFSAWDYAKDNAHRFVR